MCVCAASVGCTSREAKRWPTFCLRYSNASFSLSEPLVLIGEKDLQAIMQLLVYIYTEWDVAMAMTTSKMKINFSISQSDLKVCVRNLHVIHSITMPFGKQ